VEELTFSNYLMNSPCQISLQFKTAFEDQFMKLEVRNPKPETEKTSKSSYRSKKLEPPQKS